MEPNEATPHAEAPAEVLAAAPSAARPSRASAVWAALRATTIAVVLGVWILSALPSRPYDAERLASKRGARLVGSLDRALRSVGVPSTREGVSAFLIGTTTPLVRARNALYEPFRPALEAMQLGQRWGLFLQNGRTGYRMQVEGRRRDGTFELLYRPHREDVLGLEPALEFRRLRGIYSPTSKTSPRAQYEGFVTWLASEVFARGAAYDEVRVSMERIELGLPKDPPRILSVEHVSTRTRGGAS